MNLDALTIYKRISSQLPTYPRNNAGKAVAITTPDKNLTLTPQNTMAPGETTWDKVMGKPAMFPTKWSMVQDQPALFSGSYSDLSDKPSLSPAAQSGSYNDLTDKPALFSGAYGDLSGLPVLFDGKWSSVTGKPTTFPSTWAQVADKPPFFSGSYADLSNKPVLFSGSYADLSNRPSLFSGSYNDLTDKPSIPSMPNLATVASTGSYSDLSNKPTLFNGTWASLTGKPNFATVATSGAYSDLSGKPTTLAGFGITDAVSGSALTSALGNYTTTTVLSTLLANKADASAVKRIDTYAGTTDANGLYTVTFPTPFAAVPTIQPEPPLVGSQVWVKVSASTTGFSIRLMQRNSATVLGLELLLAAMVNVANAPARVAVIAP